MPDTATDVTTAKPASPWALIASRRFGPLLAGLSVGAFADNMFRSALVIFVQFSLYAALIAQAAPEAADALKREAASIAALAPALFMLPYFLFSATAGQLADKFDKAWWMKRLKFTEVLVMLVGAIAMNSGSIAFMMASLALAGTIAAFYSPVKYAILPQHLNPKELLTGNAIVGAATNLAILFGTVAGSILVMMDYGTHITAAVMVTLATIGWLASLYILPAPATAKDLKVNPNIVGETVNILKQATGQPGITLVIAGNAWFWFVSTLYIGQMPTMTKDVLHASEGVFNLFFMLFSVGVAAGALLVRRLQQRQPRTA